MGVHLELLKDIAKKRLFDNKENLRDSSLNNYISDIIDRTTIVEFDFTGPDIFKLMGMKKNEYHSFLQIFSDMSKKKGTGVITPYNPMGFEDPESLVILDELSANQYLLTSSQDITLLGMKTNIFFCGTSSFVRTAETGRISTLSEVLFNHTTVNGDLLNREDFISRMKLEISMNNAMITFLEQAAYLSLHPEAGITYNGKN